jgi:predicted ATP-grasp superfamily ATP-dependent carboligase
MMRRPTLPRVLVTDGDNRAALAITRSLGRRGYHVSVAERRIPALAQTSRYCAASRKYPDPATEERAFVDALVQIVRNDRIDVVLPVSDITTALVSERRSEFEPFCRVPLPSAATLALAADKVAVLKLATELGVAAPRSILVESPGAAVTDAAVLGRPVVVKPRRSRVRTPSGWTSCAVSYASTPDEIARQLAACPPEAYPVLLQERISGHGCGVFMCCRRGTVVATFGHRRLREKPPSGGVSVLSESVAVPPLARQSAAALLERLEWDGVAMVEFKMDDRDGVPKLMEINGRFWGSLQLAIDAGVDFPALLVDPSGDGGDPSPPPYRVGVKNRWFWGDVDSLLLTLRGDGPTNGSRAGRLQAMATFLKLWEPDLHYENPKFSDLRPWLYETRRWVEHSLLGVRG